MSEVRKRKQTEAERPPRTREDSVRFAIASTTMEGQTVPREAEELLAQWAEGKLSDDELMEAGKRTLSAQRGPRGIV